MKRCEECGSWEAECSSDEPVADCGCARCAVAARDKALSELARAKLACDNYWHDLERIASLCGRTADEYPLKAVMRVVAERDALRADVERLKDERDEAVRRVDAMAETLALRAERAERERDTLVRMLASEFGWEDTSYLHAMMHVENAIRNLRADLSVAVKEKANWADCWGAEVGYANRYKRERDEARALLQKVAKVCRGLEPPTDDVLSVLGNVLRERDEARAATAHARREGAEAMREAAAQELDRLLTEKKATAIWVSPDEIRALPLPGDE